MIMLIFTLFLLFPILSIPFTVLGMTLDKRFSKLYLILFCISIATIGLYYEPYYTTDGFRVLNRLTMYSGWGIDTFLNYNAFEREPISESLFYFISQINDHKVLFSISGFLVYFLTLYPVIDYSNKINSKYLVRLLAILLIISYHTLVSSLGSVRFPLGFSIIFFSWYIIYFKNLKIVGFILSISAFLVHTSFLPHIIILFISHFLYKFRKNRMLTILIWISLICWGLFSNQLSLILENLFQNEALNTVGRKLEVYVGRGYSMNIWYVINAICGTVVILITLFSIFKKKNDTDGIGLELKLNDKYLFLITNYFFFTLGSLIFANIFTRYQVLAVMLSVIPLIVQNQKNTYHTFIFNIIIVFAIITGAVNQIRMEFNVENGWINILFKNIFSLWLGK